MNGEDWEITRDIRKLLLEHMSDLKADDVLQRMSSVMRDEKINHEFVRLVQKWLAAS